MVPLRLNFTWEWSDHGTTKPHCSDGQFCLLLPPAKPTPNTVMITDWQVHALQALVTIRYNLDGQVIHTHCRRAVC